MIIDESDYLAHYGILRRSGRYPWGSGGPEYNTGNRSFLDHITNLREQGLSEVEIARGLGTSVAQLRAAKTIARTEQKQADILFAQRLKDKGVSHVEIGRRMGNINESSVRALLAPGEKDKADILEATSAVLKKAVDEKKYIDIGSGTEHHIDLSSIGVNQKIGISQTKLAAAVARLQEEGYQVHRVKHPQLGTGHQTEMKVLVSPGVTQKEVFLNRDKIRLLTDYSNDGGRTYLGIEPPKSIKSKRIKINYAEEGGSEADGVIYVRPGVEDISLGRSRYAQVRIAVDNSHYLKGMAMYKDDLPEGVDLVFNTSKKNTGNKYDAMKPLKNDIDNPFGATISRQKGVMNIVNEEGDWEKWSRSLSSQMLSKQSPELAKTQLDLTYETRRNDLDEIMKLTNPAVRRTLLEKFSEDADSAAVHLKAAAFRNQASHVILPISSIKENEIYAPNYHNGEKVVLIRHPHGGKFEIPELTVNNKNPEARKIIGTQAKDAVGIHSKVAERLSGADFDGDTVLVIPNNQGRVKTAPALEGLKNFDPRHQYPPYDGMKTIDGGTYNAKTKEIEFGPGQKRHAQNMQHQMGAISNLITDMTIRGAPAPELARAVRHSMVIIDSEKHGLNHKQSEIDNGIAQLRAKYQGKEQGNKRVGASTLISRKKRTIDVPERKQGFGIDPDTGKKIYRTTGATKLNKTGEIVPRTTKVSLLNEIDDAHKLSSGTRIEEVYANHSNRLKELANAARKEAVNTKSLPYSPSAKTAYANEVASLNSKLNIALKNRPLERQAQVLAASVVHQKKQANPDMDRTEEKKVKAQALAEARTRMGAKKHDIEFTPSEWEAVQAGAITNSKLTTMLKNADLDQVKKLATPKTSILMTPTKTAAAKAMANSGYTQAEIAAHLGVSLTTLKKSLEGS